jgi:spore germination protein GerM
MKIKIDLNDGNDNPNFEDCGKICAVTITIPKTKAVAKAALDELVKGATETEKAQNLSSIFSIETKSIIKSVNVNKGAAYVNLDNWVIENLGTATTSCGAFTFITPIEKTLQQFPSVKRVFFAIEGIPRIFTIGCRSANVRKN